MTNIKIKTKGMHCRSCEMLVKEALEGLKGVNTVEASHKSGVVSVDFDDSKINQDKVVQVIEKEGYEINRR